MLKAVPLRISLDKSIPSLPLPSLQVNNACATGSTALMLAKQLIEGRSAECVLALGFEKMERGSLTAHVRTYVCTCVCMWWHVRMHMCLHVVACTHMCLHVVAVRMHMCLHVVACTYAHVFACGGMYVRTCVCMWWHVRTCVCMWWHVRTYMCLHVVACTYMCLHVVACTYMCLHVVACTYARVFACGGMYVHVFACGGMYMLPHVMTCTYHVHCMHMTCMLLQFTDRSNPMEKHLPVLSSKYGITAAPMTPQMFGAAGREHMEKYGESWGGGCF